MSATPDQDQDRLLDMLLAGTPDRVVDLAASVEPGGIAEVDALREALAGLALALDPVAPPPDLRGRIAAAIDAQPRTPRRAALVVMDMQVDHLTPGRPLEIPRAREIVPAMKARLEEARRQGDPVVYLCDRHEPGDPELDAWTMHNMAGDPGSEVWPEIAPQAGDAVVNHRSYSGFFQSKLDEVLKDLGVDTVVLTGCVTEIHVFVTAADALQRGYKVELPRDCQAGFSPMSEQVALGMLSVMVPTEPWAPPPAPAMG